MTRFLHITDLHISVSQKDGTAQGSDTIATLDRLIDLAGTLNPVPDFIVVSGDLTDTGDAASYQVIADRFARLDIPVVMTLGNHDRRAGWHAVFPGHTAAPDGPVDHDRVLAGVHVIALDSSLPGRISGALDAAQLAHAADMLERHPDLPKLVAIHHPPRLNPDNRFSWATLDAATTDALAEMLSGRNVLAVLSGHVHMNRMGMWNGIPLVITMGQHSTIDLTRIDALCVIEGTGFAICDLLPAGLQVSYASLDPPRPIKEVSLDRLKALS